MVKYLFAVIFYATINCSAVLAQFGQVQKDLIITNKEKNQIIDTIIKSLYRSYVYPETALQVGTALRTHQKKGDYDNVQVAKESALTTAHIAALKKLLETSTEEKRKIELTEMLSRMQSTPK